MEYVMPPENVPLVTEQASPPIPEEHVEPVAADGFARHAMAQEYPAIQPLTVLMEPSEQPRCKRPRSVEYVTPPENVPLVTEQAFRLIQTAYVELATEVAGA